MWHLEHFTFFQKEKKKAQPDTLNLLASPPPLFFPEDTVI